MKTGSKPGPVIPQALSLRWRQAANKVALVLLLLGFSCSGVHWAAAAGLPSGFTEEPVPGPWNEAVGLTFEPDQQTPGGRMYVWERGGRVWIVENGVKQSTPLIDLSQEVGGWRDFGLLGFALHPNFRQNGYLYFSYIVDHHHLTKFGTPAYHPDTNEYFMATIGRITRYTARASDDFRSVDPASRRVLLGESITNGFPITYQSHGVGSLVFGTDGSLLAACGDGASYSTTDLGSAPETYFTQALAEGIIRPKENIGALRAQMVDSLAGKVVRLDPNTGDGLPTNPFFEPASPRSARSRVWALGLRNPYRTALRPGTGSHSPADGNPGALYIGDVGWRTYEDLNVVTGPGQNFGWPIYEGLEVQTAYRTPNIENQDALNPLFGVSGCTRRYFYFKELLRQDSLTPPTWPNPCNASVQIPSTIPRFVHARPALDWRHETGPARTGTYAANGTATVTNVGATGSPVSGNQFGGTSSIGGTWYQGDDFPAIYKNTYFNGDYEGQWIRSFVFDTNNKPVAVRDFMTNGGGIVAIATHPVEGSLYYVSWSSNITRIRFTGSGNQPPKAVATANLGYGPSPFLVQFDGSASVDPEGKPLTYLWNFGDGSTNSTQANPSHTFTAPVGTPTTFPVVLTVTDASNATAQATVLISVNNTPPNVSITSPTNGMLYPVTGETTYALTANISDAEHGPNQLACEWQTILHHNHHTHGDPVDTNCATTTILAPTGCEGENYFYSIHLKVTDAAGLSTTQEVHLFPNCPGLAATLKYLGQDGAGVIHWQLTGASTRSYLVEGSTNLVGWTPVTTVQPATGTAEFNDASASAHQFRFYRAVLVP